MHGRIKTISTAEQQLKQKKVREAKVLAYKAAISALQKKRSEDSFDDDALNLTRDILQANPDIITAWNYRREILIARKKTVEETDFQKMLEGELSFTELGLRVNPKSYGTWHHRLWVLDLMPPNMWQKEVILCNKYLSMDERNFHCWDYRKLVVASAEIPDLEEYNFTTQKIESNFSNYSAWHYRSKLLPRLFKDPTEKFPLEEEKHRNELELVQNAAFTDPDDQSAWFYQRWLLGLRQPKLAIVSGYFRDNQICVALSRKIRLDPEHCLEIVVGDVTILGDWKGTQGKSSTVFVFLPTDAVPLDSIVRVILKKASDNSEILDTAQFTSSASFNRSPLFSPEYGPDMKTTLCEQLKYCQELLELEPESKWTLLTSVFLMHSIDLKSYATEILRALSSLTIVDPFRKGYYSDVLSKVRIELALLAAPQLSALSISDGLTCLYHTQYLILTTTVSFAGNKLKDGHLKKFHCLLSCKKLALDDNEITKLDNLPILEGLEELTIRGNPLQDIDLAKEYLKRFPSLTQIFI